MTEGRTTLIIAIICRRDQQKISRHDQSKRTHSNVETQTMLLNEFWMTMKEPFTGIIIFSHGVEAVPTMVNKGILMLTVKPKRA